MTPQQTLALLALLADLYAQISALQVEVSDLKDALAGSPDA
jgi:hypothetical protein